GRHLSTRGRLRSGGRSRDRLIRFLVISMTRTTTFSTDVWIRPSGAGRASPTMAAMTSVPTPVGRHDAWGLAEQMGGTVRVSVADHRRYVESLRRADTL